MVEVVIFAEGETEEQFIKQVVSHTLRPLQVFLKPEQLKTSSESKGGAVSFDRLKFYARNTLRSKPKAILSTFLDLYKLDTSFPGFAEAKNKPDLEGRVRHLEDALRTAIAEYVNCDPERIIPHIQPHEFEGLLFSDPDAIASTESGWASSLNQLREVREAFETPEHINDGFETKPSCRLKQILRPAYKKVRHGPLAAKRVTLERMEAECPCFKGWMDALRSLHEFNPRL